MKRSNPLLFPILIIFYLTIRTTSAQITISDSSAPSAAENIIYSQSNVPVDVSKTGPNMVWDYSGIITTSQDTFKFLSPKDINSAYTSTYNGDLGLDLKNPNVNGMFAFFKTSSSDFRQLGLGITIPLINAPTALPYSSPDIVYHFPIKYGNVDSCNYYGSATILLYNASITGKRVDTVDGWGTVITPYKTYQCLRIKSVVTEVDSLVSTMINNYTIEYKWISNTEHIPVLEVDVIPNGSGGTSMGIRYRDSYHNFENPNGPYVDFTASDSNIYVHDTVSFTDKSVGMSSWLWTILPMTYTYADGTSKTSQNPKVTFNNEGIYSVSMIGTDPSGGGNKKVKLNYINVTHNAGITNLENVNNPLAIYPNPARTDFLIKLDPWMNGKMYQLNIMNSNGAQIMDQFQRGISGSYLKLCLKNEPAGMYFVKLMVNDQQFTKTIIWEGN